VTDTEVQIDTGDVSLAGTLVEPANPKAVVIFVHGSGPQDRNQNSSSAQLNVFNTLADDVAEMGVASLRYDKRGVAGSTGDFQLLTQSELITDLRKCIAWVQARGLGPVYLCGHSEGTAIAADAARGLDVAGLVLLCPYITDGPAILRWQAQQLQATLDAATGLKGLFGRAVARVFGGPERLQAKMINRVQSRTADFVRVAGKRVPARWMRDFLTADVAALHRENTRPTLVLVAGRDCQCPPADGAVIAQLNSQATLVVLDDLSHLLRHGATDGFSDYARQLKQPMDPRVTAIVREWLNDQFSA
jgi:pimeloyl-ACP methyl ester carboxylesterase